MFWRKNMKIAYRFIIAIVALLTVLMMGNVTAQDNLTVSVEAWMVEKYNMPELEAQFEAAHPGVDVVVITHEGLGANYLNIFLEWAQTGKSTADLYFGGLVRQLSPDINDDQLPMKFPLIGGYRRFWTRLMWMAQRVQITRPYLAWVRP
jgi:ABC-type glycerol-3-phosphate transport system substrate-binding protein